jgi:hypothetical protein
MRHLPNAVAAVLAICALASPYGARAATFVLEGPWPSRAASPVGRNYQLFAGSPAIKTGPSMGPDLHGIARPQLHDSTHGR